MQGREDEAIQIARDAVAVAERGSTEVDNRRLNAYELLANLIEASEPEESLELRVKALAAHRRLLPDRPNLAGEISQLAFLLRQAGRIDDAVTMYRDLLDHIDRYQQSSIGPPRVLTDLGDMYREIGQPKKALAAFSESILINPHPVPIVFLYEVQALVESGQFDRAKEAAAKLVESENADSSMVAISKVTDGLIAIAKEDFQQAAEIIKEVVLELEEAKGNYRVLNALKRLLCDCRIKLEQFAAAEFGLYALRRQTMRGGYYRTDRRWIVLSLIDLYEAWDKPDELVHWIQMSKFSRSTAFRQGIQARRRARLGL